MRRSEINAAFESAYPNAPLGCQWNSMADYYAQTWDELGSDLEDEYERYNELYLSFKAGWDARP